MGLEVEGSGFRAKGFRGLGFRAKGQLPLILPIITYVLQVPPTAQYTRLLLCRLSLDPEVVAAATN